MLANRVTICAVIAVSPKWAPAFKAAHFWYRVLERSNEHEKSEDWWIVLYSSFPKNAVVWSSRRFLVFIICFAGRGVARSALHELPTGDHRAHAHDFDWLALRGQDEVQASLADDVLDRELTRQVWEYIASSSFVRCTKNNKGYPMLCVVNENCTFPITLLQRYPHFLPVDVVTLFVINAE